MTTITLEVTPTTPDQLRQAREAAVLQTLRELDRPIGLLALTAAMPDIPVQTLPGYATIRRPGLDAVRSTLYRLMRLRRVLRTEVRTGGTIRYLYEVAA